MTFLVEGPEDCIVCGAPKGACGPHDGSDPPPVSPLFIEWAPEYKAPPERTPMADDVIAQARIYEEVPIPRSDRTRRVLRFGVGAVIPASDQKRLNVKGDGTQSTVPLAEVDESGMVVPLPSLAGGQTTTAPRLQRDPVTSTAAKAGTTTKAPARKAAKASTKRR